MKSDTYFAAFVMTYKRVSVLEQTIKTLLEQSYPPQMILVIDNDPDCSAAGIKSKFEGAPVLYHAMGWNSGPAGASKKGLEILVNKGYRWIGWTDDDDPPVFNDTFEILLKMAIANKHCGCVGTVGQYFDRKKGLMVRVPDEELNKTGSLEVDNIAGGMCKIVNAAVCLKGNIFPDETLFYGFEELDFDLRLQKAGYTLLTDRALYKRHRIYYNRLNLNKKRGAKKEKGKLWREHYSTRNSLIILAKNSHLQALLLSFIRSVIKIFLGFQFGLGYGALNARIISKALFHYFLGKRGAVVLPVK